MNLKLTMGVAAATLVAGSVSIKAAAIPLAADAYVRSGSQAALNFGTATDINVKAGTESADAQITRKGYFRFDKTTLPGGVNSSVLSLTVQTNTPTTTPLTGATFHVYGVNNGVANENFGETTITYNNAPANTAGTNAVVVGSVTDIGTFFLPATTALGSTIVAASGTALDAFISADTNNVLTFLIVRDTIETGYNSGFFSKENSVATAPTLTATAVPEPVSLSLLGLGGAALLRRKRI